jgi:hypothetical protein
MVKDELRGESGTQISRCSIVSMDPEDGMTALKLAAIFNRLEAGLSEGVFMAKLLMEEIQHQLTVTFSHYIFLGFFRVSTILLVVQDFATIRRV